MATVIPIGEPNNEAERLAIAHLRDHLPANYTIFHNFEIRKDGEFFEIDLAIIAPHAVYLVDVKGTQGLIDIYGPKWYPEGRQPFASPLLKLRSHARAIKGILTQSNPARQEIEKVYVDAAILLTSSNAHVIDPANLDKPNVANLATSAAFFQNISRLPGYFSKNIAPLHNLVRAAIQGIARKRTGPLRFGNWEVKERLGGTDAYTEYRAFNYYAGPRSGTVLLRSYKADPYLPPAERESQKTRIVNAYKALSVLGPHPNIVGARDFFATEDTDQYILVTEDMPGKALRLHIEKPALALTFDQKCRLTRDMLEALAFLHSQGVVHRNLTPSTVLVGSDGSARLVGFDFARSGSDRSRTIADKIIDELDPAYLAPELYSEPSKATAASDMFSAGLVLFEMFSGQKAFAKGLSEVFDKGSIFDKKPSELRSELSAGFDAWLQKLCAFQSDQRLTAQQAATELSSLLQSSPKLPPKPAAPPPMRLDYNNLVEGTQLTQKYIVVKRLGNPGSFGVVYKVIDTLGDIARAIKIVLRDRYSTTDRLKQEYRTLLRVPEHKYVVRVLDADFLPQDSTPFIVFEHVDGSDLAEMLNQKLVGPEDALELARQVAEGLVHLHKHDVFHCDIKPSNILWTKDGAKIIDFNVSVRSGDRGRAGGSRRYLPADFDPEAIVQSTDLADRDVYALGITVYEVLTGQYPWSGVSTPLPNQPPKDPREISGFADLDPALSEAICKAIAPKRTQRFGSALELQTAIEKIQRARRLSSIVPPTEPPTGFGSSGSTPPNTNPYVSHLLTLYSQSKRTNAGTRGLDAKSEQTYVETSLDRDLVKAVLAGEFALVIITGNAGDGKTAFLQKLETRAKDEGAILDHSLSNGCSFTYKGRTYLSNYDGSQDEDAQANDDVLRSFFGPFSGDEESKWPHNEVRLIAINEGRLNDFFSSEGKNFSLLQAIVRRGLATGIPEQRVAIVNLNLRSVVSDPKGGTDSILERLLRRMTHEEFWEPCRGCDIKEKCYVYHNAQTFQDEIAGPKVIERFKAIYTLSHLRGRLHITLRDLRSALAYMIAGTRDCQEIHQLYQGENRDEILQGFYFNSWMGGDLVTADRLLSLLKDIDTGQGSDPRLDRSLDFVSPTEDRSLFRFENRGSYEQDLLRGMFRNLPRNFSGQPSSHLAESNRHYVSLLRRRYFFERRDEGWREMLPYRSASQLLSLVQSEPKSLETLPEVLQAINRGEGLSSPAQLQGKLALQVRQVENGTIRSYRVFPESSFSLHVKEDAKVRFVEHMTNGLVLRYQNPENKNQAELIINLDVFEMLQRLNEGYRPSIEEEQGYYLSLTVFKNLLSAEPYQEVLLTTTGYDFYRIERHPDGRLEMSQP